MANPSFLDNLNYHVSTIKHDAWICITIYTVYTYVYIYIYIRHIRFNIPISILSPLVSHCYPLPLHTMLLRRKAPATAAFVSASPAAMAGEWMASENLGKRHWNSPTFIQFWGYFMPTAVPTNDNSKLCWTLMVYKQFINYINRLKMVQ